MCRDCVELDLVELFVFNLNQRKREIELKELNHALAKNWFQMNAGSNLETLNTILSKTNHVSAFSYLTN